MDEYLRFVEQFYKATGIDLNQYKRPQMERRLTALRNKRGFDTFDAYVQAAVRDPALLAELLDRMTINVSEFYRNKPRWDALAADIIPVVTNNGRLKIWSAACSTGEEPYTLLLMLSHLVPMANVTVLATDIDDHALQVAQAGQYPDEALAGIPEEDRKRYFTSVGNRRSAISDEVRKRITFKKHNLLRDHFDSGFDLIICRNVLIYFTDQAKDSLYQKFASALRPGGVLFVGSTEQIFRPQAFGLQQIQSFFYQRM